MADLDKTIYLLNREQEEAHTEERARKLHLPYMNLVGYPIIKEVFDLIPEEMAIRYRAVPYLKIGKQIKVGLVDPQDPEAKKYLKELEGTTGINFSISLISQTSLYYGISVYEKLRVNQVKKEEDQSALARKQAEDTSITDIKSAAEAAKTANISSLLDTLLNGAAKLKASDIHIEPAENDFLIRYRIDGVLQDIASLPISQYRQLLSRIKFMAKLRMDLSNVPQDGRFSSQVIGNLIDFRVSLMPSTFGESIVLRLLGQEKSILQLDLLGFRADALIAIKEAISRPHGMILTSGPTGSGKTSTLYAILTELKKPGVKIITLEDPVEYKIEGIEQSQIRSGEGYDFADGLKASLRQDPDILMVGEIRDVETAEIAVQAALTGHLLLSTIHANSAPAVYARLLEIGVKPFLLSGSINLIMAQRLIRKNCPACLEEYSPRPELWAEVGLVLSPISNRLPKVVLDKVANKTPKLQRGRGCEKCNNTGFIGRQVVIEVLVPNEEIEELVARKATISEFEKKAREFGMITMEQDGLVKALLGASTIEEVWRVTRS